MGSGETEEVGRAVESLIRQVRSSGCLHEGRVSLQSSLSSGVGFYILEGLLGCILEKGFGVRGGTETVTSKAGQLM